VKGIWRHRLRRVLALPRREAADLLFAQWYLVQARAQRRWTTTGRFVDLTADAPNAEVASPDAATRALGQRLALAVERAAENGPIRATCLERAVALDRLLRRHGIERARIRVGVRLDQGQFLAHAWVELGDLILADAPGRVQAFQSIAEARVAP
jgi:transglutaminase superfamily protein